MSDTQTDDEHADQRLASRWQRADIEAFRNARTEDEPLQPTEHMVLLMRLGRALDDQTRVIILALLAEAEQPLNGQQLAERLHVSPQTISHHLGILRSTGLVRERREKTARYYTLDTEMLRQIRETTFSDDHLGLPTRVEERAKVMAIFFNAEDGRLVNLPAQAGKRRYVLEELARAFTWGRLYDEREVNETLKCFYDDTATLRRALVDEGLLSREHGRYWLTRPPLAPESPLTRTAPAQE